MLAGERRRPEPPAGELRPSWSSVRSAGARELSENGPRAPCRRVRTMVSHVLRPAAPARRFRDPVEQLLHLVFADALLARPVSVLDIDHLRSVRPAAAFAEPDSSNRGSCTPTQVWRSTILVNGPGGVRRRRVPSTVCPSGACCVAVDQSTAAFSSDAIRLIQYQTRHAVTRSHAPNDQRPHLDDEPERTASSTCTAIVPEKRATSARSLIPVTRASQWPTTRHAPAGTNHRVAHTPARPPTHPLASASIVDPELSASANARAPMSTATMPRKPLRQRSFITSKHSRSRVHAFRLLDFRPWRGSRRTDQVLSAARAPLKHGKAVNGHAQTDALPHRVRHAL